MSLVYSALVPHPANLLMSGDKAKKLAETAAAFQKIKNDIKESGTNSIVLVSSAAVGPLDPYSPPVAQKNVYAYYTLDKLTTGPIQDVETGPKIFNNDLSLMQAITVKGKPLGITVGKVPRIKLDQSSSIVASLLSDPDAVYNLSVIHLPYKPVLSVVDFGTLLAAVFNSTESKIALFGIGNLSSRLSKDGAAGYKPQGKEFNDNIISGAKSNDFSKVLSMSPEDLEAAGQEAASLLAVLVGANSDAKANLMSYEELDGTGYAAISWKK